MKAPQPKTPKQKTPKETKASKASKAKAGRRPLPPEAVASKRISVRVRPSVVEDLAALVDHERARAQASGMPSPLVSAIGPASVVVQLVEAAARAARAEGQVSP